MATSMTKVSSFRLLYILLFPEMAGFSSIVYMLRDCKPELQMMYAGSKLSLVNQVSEL